MSQLSLARLRASTPSEIASVLRESLAEPNVDLAAITQQIVTAVAAETISPAYIPRIWLDVTRDPQVLTSFLRQPHSSVTRHAAMHDISSHVHHEATFLALWDALGGAKGLVDLMAQMSEMDVKKLCVLLCNTATLEGPLRTRQEKISELLALLLDETRNPETRPFKFLHPLLAPACTEEVALQWVDKVESMDMASTYCASDEPEPYAKERLLQTIRKKLRMAHRDAYELRVLQLLGEADESDVPKRCDKLEPFLRTRFDFGVKVVTFFAESASLNGAQTAWVLETLFARVVNQAAQRKDKDLQIRVWRLINQCLQKHLALGKATTRVYSYGDRPPLHNLLIRLAKAWRPAEPAWNEILDTYLGLLQPQVVKQELFPVLLKIVRPSHRWQLLRVLFLRLPEYSFDIGDATSTSTSEWRGPKIRLDTMEPLPRAEALTLFERCLEAYGDYSFMREETSENAEDAFFNIEYPGRSPDPYCYRARMINKALESQVDLVLPDDPRSVLKDMADKELHRRKKLAQSERNRDIRAFWASATVHLAAAIQDLDVYSETLKWARRFDKDFEVVKQIYRDLESPLLSSLLTSRSVLDLEYRVNKGNEIIFALIETAIAGMQEPSFQWYNWTEVLKLPWDIVNIRLQDLSELQERFQLSDTALEEKVLQPILSMMLQVESTLLKPENERLNAQPPDCPLQVQTESDTYSDRAARFIDDHAKARDALWREHRQAERPHIYTLDRQWPRGLCAHHLVPQNYKGKLTSMPYIKSRVDAILFPQPECVLAPAPEDEETLQAIGSFVESWGIALDLYLQEASDKLEREALIEKAWNYTIEHLRGDRMTPVEARRFWKQYFPEFLALERENRKIYARVTERVHPDLPTVEDPTAPVEWNPEPNRPKPKLAKDRTLDQIVCLDVMLPNAENKYYKTEADFSHKRVIPGDTQSTVGDYCITSNDLKRSKLSGNALDAIYTAAMLVIDGQCSLSSGLLLKPFTSVSPEERRIPALYLDGEFLELNKEEWEGTWGYVGMLHHNGNHIPTQLISSLASTAFDRLYEKRKNGETLHSPFVKLVKILIEGDKPDSAIPLVQRFILDLPEESSWHRQLIQDGKFLRRLSPEAASKFLVTLTDAVVDRLTKSTRPKGDPPTDSERLPWVKVSTVKMLAQILRNGRFVEIDTSFSLLTRIMRSSKHLDIRVAAFQSMREALSEPQLRDKVISVWREQLVPMAGSLTERVQLSEEDWLLAEKTQTLPEAEMTERPIFDLLITTQRSLKNVNLYAAKCLGQLIEEALSMSARLHGRWINLFLHKYNLGALANIVPCVPASPQDLIKWLGFRDFQDIPEKTFDLIRQYVMFTLDPPPEMKAAVKQMRGNRSTMVAPETVHFLKVFDFSTGLAALDPSARKSGPKIRDMMYLGVNWVISGLPEYVPNRPNVKKPLIPFEKVESLILEIADVVIRDGHFAVFESFTWRISISDQHKNVPMLDPWGNILRQIIAKIDGKRTTAWQMDGTSQPRFLPETFPLKDRLVGTSATVGSGDQHFSTDFISCFHHSLFLLQNVIDNNLPYNDVYDHLHKMARYKRKVPTALLFGAPMVKITTPTLLHHLRVQLAVKMLEDVRTIDEDSQKYVVAVRKMIAGWWASPVEKFRRQAWKARKTFETKNIHWGEDDFLVTNGWMEEGENWLEGKEGEDKVEGEAVWEELMGIDPDGHLHVDEWWRV